MVVHTFGVRVHVHVHGCSEERESLRVITMAINYDDEEETDR